MSGGFFDFFKGPVGGILTGGLVPLIAGAFGGGGGGGQQQSPMSSYTPPPVPTLTDPSVQAAALAQNTAAANARGRASTIMTSGQGDTSPLTTAKKQLLGA